MVHGDQHWEIWGNQLYATVDCLMSEPLPWWETNCMEEVSEVLRHHSWPAPNLHKPCLHLLQHACSIRAKLFPFLSCDSTVQMHTKVTTYLLFLTIILTYTAPAFWSCSQPPTNPKWKGFNPRPSFTSPSLSVLHNTIKFDLKIPSLEETVRSLVLTFFTNVSHSSHSHLQWLSTLCSLITT